MKAEIVVHQARTANPHLVYQNLWPPQIQIKPIGHCTTRRSQTCPLPLLLLQRGADNEAVPNKSAELSEPNNIWFRNGRFGLNLFQFFTIFTSIPRVLWFKPAQVVSDVPLSCGMSLRQKVFEDVCSTSALRRVPNKRLYIYTNVY